MAAVVSVIRRSRRGTLWKTIGFLVCIIFLIQLRAETNRFLIDSWGTENGLPDNFVTSLIQTPDGYLWIGTYNGLARFDGVRFEAFKPSNTPELVHARIVKLFLDAQGTLWINTYDGSLVSWRNGVFTREWSGEGKGNSEVWLVSDDSRQITFAFRSGLLIRRSLEHGATNDWKILKPPGNPPGAFYSEDADAGLWCSTLDGKLWRVIDGKFEVVSPKENGLQGSEIHWLAADLPKHIWVGTEKEIARWDGKQFQNMNPSGESDLNVDSFFFTPDGGALIAAGGRVRKYLHQQWISDFQKLPDLSQEQMLQQSVFRDREGGLWQISRGMGIVHITPDNAIQQISAPDGLPGDHTTSWLEDREGNFWVGLAHGGIVRLRKKSFKVLGISGGVPDRAAMSVCEDKTGAVWVGTYGGGLNCWRNGTMTNFPVMQNSGGFVFSVFPDEHGRLWMSAGMEDIFLFHDEQMTVAPVAVHGVKSILIDRKGDVWMGRKDGVARWAGGKLEVWDSVGSPGTELEFAL